MPQNLKRTIKNLSLLLVLLTGVSAQTSWELTSPGGNLRGTIQFANLNSEADYPPEQRLYYSVSIGSPNNFTEVVEPSPMGLIRQDEDFADDLTFDSVGQVSLITDSYTMITGKKSSINSTANERVLYLSSDSGKKLQLILRAYDDGFAFRYRFPETDNSDYTVTRELTGFRIPQGARGWMLPHTAFEQFGPGYEAFWQHDVSVGTNAPSSVGWCFPALFKVGDNWVMIGETDVLGTYVGATMEQAVNQRIYRLRFPPDEEGNGTGSVNPSSSLPWETPWRFVMAGTDLGVIIESTLFHDLATLSKVDDVSWINPGRSSWSWWAHEGSHTEYDVNTPFVDLARDMTWEYSLIDHDWNGNTVQSLIDYGNQQNVGIMVWYNSGGPHNTVTHMGPRDRMHTQSVRRSEMQTISGWGVKGIKVDFFHSDKQNIINQYIGILEDAADFNLLVNFHGCTIPRGWQRTYPHLMTAEAGRGAEWYKFQPEYPAGAPRRNTILVFARNVLTSMDYTPVTFTNHNNAHITTYGHELALSIVFESGLQHFADRVSGYENLPSEPKAFLREVPTTWDDTRYIEGTPGDYVVLARRKGDDWYLGGIDGGGSSRNLSLDLSFLGDYSGDGFDMSLITDGSSNTTFNSSTAVYNPGSALNVSVRGNGGFVAKLVNRDPVVSIAKQKFSLTEKGKLISMGPGSNLQELKKILTDGKLDAIEVYDFSGRKLKAGEVRQLFETGVSSQKLLIMKGPPEKN